MPDDDLVPEALSIALSADKDVAQEVVALLQACIRVARALDLPPEIMVMSALSLIVVGVRQHVSCRELFAGTEILCMLREHLEKTGHLALVRIEERIEEHPDRRKEN